MSGSSSTKTVAAKQPPLFWRILMKLQNPFMKRLLRSPLHIFVSRIYLLLTFTGRKSGKIYSTPVQYAQVNNTVYIITSEGYTWWKNLRGGAPVEMRLRGKQYRGMASTSTDPQMISDTLTTVYPQLSVTQRQKFIHGKVVITVVIENN